MNSIKYFALASMVLSLLAASAEAQPRRVKDVACPLEYLEWDVTSRLPAGWWSTGARGQLVRAETYDIGGSPALVCSYSDDPGPGHIMSRYPQNMVHCDVRGKGFRCTTVRPTQSQSPSQMEDPAAPPPSASIKVEPQVKVVPQGKPSATVKVTPSEKK